MILVGAKTSLEALVKYVPKCCERVIHHPSISLAGRLAALCKKYYSGVVTGPPGPLRFISSRDIHSCHIICGLLSPIQRYLSRRRGQRSYATLMKLAAMSLRPPYGATSNRAHHGSASELCDHPSDQASLQAIHLPLCYRPFCLENFQEPASLEPTLTSARSSSSG